MKFSEQNYKLAKLYIKFMKQSKRRKTFIGYASEQNISEGITKQFLFDLINVSGTLDHLQEFINKFEYIRNKVK